MIEDARRWTSSDLLFTYVMEADGIDPRLKKSFERIKFVCDELEAEVKNQLRRGVKFTSSPIYIAEIGRRCKVRFGGPSGESILRNRRTEPLKAAYIELRGEELVLPDSDKGNRDPLHSVNDAHLLAYIRMLEGRVKVGEEMVNGLANTLRKMRPISLDVALASSSDEVDELEIGMGQDKSIEHDQVRALVAKLLDARHLSRFGLLLERSVFNPATGDELLSPDDVAFLRRLAGGS